MEGAEACVRVSVDLHGDVPLGDAEFRKTLKAYAIVGTVHFVVSANVQLEDIVQLVKDVNCDVDGPFLASAEVAVRVLSEGALRVCVSQEIATELIAHQIDGKRIVVKVSPSDSPLFPLADCSYLVSTESGDSVVALLSSGDAATAAIQEQSHHVTFANATTTNAIKAIDTVGGIALIPATALGDGTLTLAAAITSILTTDRPDGLYTTAVVDENKRFLGICYSNAESIAKSIEIGEGVYHSRKRGLWHKGLTSGDTQTLHAIRYDCDRDLLEFEVTQHGRGFCHRGMYGCTADRSGFSRLENTLAARVNDPTITGYTRKLLEDADMLQKKVVEEAIELTEAKDKAHIAAEMADLMYFSMVFLAKNGVTLQDVQRNLDRRDLQLKRRHGVAKPSFIQDKVGKILGHGNGNGKQQAQSDGEDTHPAKKSKPEAHAPTSTSDITLRRISMDEVPPLHRDPVNPKARSIAEGIMKDVQQRGEVAVIEHAVRLGDIKAGQQHIYTLDELKPYFDALSDKEKGILERTAHRIRVFAEAQLASLTDVTDTEIPGGKAGQVVSPVEIAGCYAPGGRYPLPSSVLMGAVTARVAGVKQVWVASPRPHPSVLAAAYISGVDGLLAVGGCQAIAAFTYGCGKVPTCDAIVGPGNMFVTAAKSLVAGSVAIDMLAGPSECLVVADSTANPEVVASDLIAQSEHDVAARAILVTPDATFVEEVDKALTRQLADLPTAETARVALEKNSFAVVTKTLAEAVDVADRIAPEHLEVHTNNYHELVDKFNHYGALFVGHHAAEVMGDYGAGPNHTLPTGGTARSFGGLSVHTFLRCRTWMRIDNVEESQELVQDAVDLALMEGLHGHSRSAAMRLVKK